MIPHPRTVPPVDQKGSAVMSPNEQESVIMDMWEVPPGRQQEVIDALREAP